MTSLIQTTSCVTPLSDPCEMITTKEQQRLDYCNRLLDDCILYSNTSSLDKKQELLKKINTLLNSDALSRHLICGFKISLAKHRRLSEDAQIEFLSSYISDFIGAVKKLQRMSVAELLFSNGTIKITWDQIWWWNLRELCCNYFFSWNFLIIDHVYICTCN